MASKEEGREPRAKGFGFVWMMSRKDAEKAIEGANGVTLGGGKEEDSNAKGKERVIAVDWALSKEKWEVEKEKIMEQQGEEGGSDNGEGSSSGSSSENDDDDDDDSSEDGHVGVHEDSDEESDEDGSERSDEEEVERPQLPPPETGNTIFIRNVPFDATEDELRTL